jgi:hypothetical protein
VSGSQIEQGEGALPAPPPPGWIQLFDGFFPALVPGEYTIGVSQTVPGPSGPKPYESSQAFTVQAPEFFIDPAGVEAVNPPAGGADRFEQDLPFVVLADPALPWERALTPGEGPATEQHPQPWLALLLFAEEELVMPPGSGTDPTTSMTVEALLASDLEVLKPTLPEHWVAADMLASQCRTITVSGSAFIAAVPHVDELSLLAHVRAVNTSGQGQQLQSVVLANRLPVTGASAVRWHAHLVSLEGLEPYLKAGAALPCKPGTSTPQDVMLVSLYGWTFTSLPEAGFGFSQLAAGLRASESGEGCPGLALPAGQKLPEPVAGRLAEGYAPLTFRTISGEESFAWYRGPLSPVVPEPLPGLGQEKLAVAEAPTADALTIYLKEQGLFDLSYAAAWNAGRNMALADGAFAQAVHSLRLRARRTASTLAQRLALSHLAGAGGDNDPTALLVRDAGRARFATLMADGLGERWHDAVGGAGEGRRSNFGSFAHRRRQAPRAVLSCEQLLAHPGARSALSAELVEDAQPVAAWIRRARLLEDLPFVHLVPDPRMLPPESIRFFYVDPGWLDAITAGALSLALHSSADADLQKALQELLVPAPESISGLLIRSQMVADTPGLEIAATLEGAPLTLLRDDVLAPGVRLTLFQGVPDRVTVSQPAHGLIFGVEDEGLQPRALTGGPIGAQLCGAGPVAVPTRPYGHGAIGGVVEVTKLAETLATAAGVAPYSAGAAVAWNGTALATSRIDANTLTATVPKALLAEAKTANVTVLDGGVGSAPASFAIEPAFGIAQLSPSTVIAGSDAFALTIEGQGFGTDATVELNAAAKLPTEPISTTIVRAQVPASAIASAGSAAVTVTSAGATTPAVTLPIVTGQPEIDALSPSAVGAGRGGFTLEAIGSGFVPGAGVRWNGTSLVTSFIDEAHLTAAVTASLLADPADVAIAVALPAGAVSNQAMLTIAPSGTPVIDAVSPSVAIAGSGGFELTVDGANFTAATKLAWNGTALTTTVDDSGQLTATAPAGLSAGEVSLTATTGTATSAPWPFTVLPAACPTVGLLVPASAAAGSGDLTLTVHGGFGAGDLALQLVKAPERLTFVPQGGEQ